MKKLLSIGMAIVMAASLAACGGSSSGTTAAATTAAATTAAAATEAPKADAKASEGEEITIRVGTVGADDHSYSWAAYKFSEILKEKSGGRINAQVFTNGQLGSERDMAEGVTMGTLDMTIVTMDGAIPTWVPDTAVMSIPYLFANVDEAYDALDNYIYDRLEPDYEAVGMKNLGFTALGMRHFSNNVRPIHSAEDCKGLTIRVQESPVWFGLCDALGAVASPISFSELYTALQQGVVDGQENPIGTIATSKFYEVQKYVSLDGHTFGAGNMIMNLNKFNSLSPEDQELVMECAKEACIADREYMAAQEAEWLQTIKDSGTEVDENPDLESFVEATKGMELKDDIKAGFKDVTIVQGVRDYLAK